MAASSQGEEDEDERLALERELAAELAAMSSDDIGLDGDLDGQGDMGINYDSNDNVESDYIRLNLDEVLQQAAQVSARRMPLAPIQGNNDDCNGETNATTSWELLLQSVKRNDREFFQLFHDDLNDIRTSILDVKPSIPSLQQQKEVDTDDKQSNGLAQEADRGTIGSVVSRSGLTDLSSSVHENGKQCDEEGELNCNQITQVEISCSVALDTGISNDIQSLSVTEALTSVTSRPSSPKPKEVATSLHIVLLKEQKTPALTAQEILSSVDNGQKELEAITQQHAIRESRRLKAEARRQKERDDAARLLRQLQEDLEAHERDAETARCESRERSLMATEESFSRRYAAAEREAQESELMTLADEASRQVEKLLARIQAVISKELDQMAAEDRAERHRMQAKKQFLHAQQLNLARSHFGVVLLELMKFHQVQRQLSDQVMKRERRECVQMRAEEAYTRRMMAETRVLQEQQVREKNRSLMLCEDDLARSLEAEERKQIRQKEERRSEELCRELMEHEEKRIHSAMAYMEILYKVQKQREERSRLSMELEEVRCREAWTYLTELAQSKAREREAQRLRSLSKVSAGFQALEGIYRHHELVQCLGRWKWWNAQCTDGEKARSAENENAATRIQMWHRSRRLRLQQVLSVDPPLVLEDMSEDGEEPQEDEDDGNANIQAIEDNYVESGASQNAARRLQSTFRGFHVRRKFANALALAQEVENQGENDAFDAVDLDDLIQLPPELVDGWEDPVLPPAAFVSRKSPPPQFNNCEEERAEHMHAEGFVEGGNNVESNTFTGKPRAPIVQTHVSPVKEQSLAATLWSKMSRSKQKQQHTQQERQRQLDPVYRVQRLLNRKSGNRGNSSSSNNQSSHSRSQTPQGNQKAANMVTWSSTSNAKKKPKVKLPSLVERLRRQTMDER